MKRLSPVNAKEAREYISNFHKMEGCEPVEFIMTSSGSLLSVSALTDSDAIHVAIKMIQAQTKKAVKEAKKGVTIQ